MATTSLKNGRPRSLKSGHPGSRWRSLRTCLDLSSSEYRRCLLREIIQEMCARGTKGDGSRQQWAAGERLRYARRQFASKWLGGVIASERDQPVDPQSHRYAPVIFILLPLLHFHSFSNPSLPPPSCRAPPSFIQDTMPSLPRPPPQASPSRAPFSCP